VRSSFFFLHRSRYIDDCLLSKESLCIYAPVYHTNILSTGIVCYAPGRMTRHIPPPCSRCSNRGYDDDNQWTITRLMAYPTTTVRTWGQLGTYNNCRIYDIILTGRYVIEIVESRRTTTDFSRSFGYYYILLLFNASCV